MKIAIAQINSHVGNFTANREKIIEFAHRALSEGAELVVFPELSISGYPARDFLDFDDYTTRCLSEIANIAHSCPDIGIIVGSPAFNNSKAGKMLFNAAFLLYQGQIYSQTNKALLPTYDIFDEYRYFEPDFNFNTISFKNTNIALTICEDLWNIEGRKLYKADPMQELSKQNPDLIINIAASPFNYAQQHQRYEVLSYHAKKYSIPIVYSNLVGAQTELIFDGDSQVINAMGQRVIHAPRFEEALLFFDTRHHYSPILAEENAEMDQIEKALVSGIRDYFRKLGFKKALIGLSGGIDSALVTVLAAKALGPENVVALMLPSRFSSGHSIDDSKEL